MERHIAVLMAIDEPYAAPLCVTVTSMLENLRPGVGLDLYVMGSGLGADTRRTLERTFDDRVSLTWLPVDDTKLGSLRGYGSVAAPVVNFRLLR